MEQFRRDELKSLMEGTAGPCISIYLPIHHGGAESKTDPVRLKNAVRDAEQLLTARGLDTEQVRTLLEPIRIMADETEFTQREESGYVVLRSESLFKVYFLRVPFEESVTVADHFYVKPLLPLMKEEDDFFVLALTRKNTRLLHMTENSIHEVPFPEGTPTSVDEALQVEFDSDDGRQHFGLSAQAGGVGERSGGHFGTGAPDDHHMKQYFAQFCAKIDKAVREVLKDSKRPLVVACVDYEFPIYRDHNTYQHLVDKNVSGSPDGLVGGELQSRALEIVRPLFDAPKERARQQYEKLAGTEKTTTSLKEVVRAAHDGRVSALFVAEGTQKLGHFDEETRKVHAPQKVENGEEDLLNVAALQTIMHGGDVFLVPMDQVPGQSPMAAVLRY